MNTDCAQATAELARNLFGLGARFPAVTSPPTTRCGAGFAQLTAIAIGKLTSIARGLAYHPHDLHLLTMFNAMQQAGVKTR
jgi:hypothetical protein